MKSKLRVTVLVACAGLLAFYLAAYPRTGEEQSGPTPFTALKAPVSAPIVTANTFDAAAQAAANLERLHSLLVSYRGELLLERYYNGTTRTRLANMKSASKSVLSALIGIAIERGHIENVGQPIGPYFTEFLKSERDAPKRVITVEDLLTMRSGLETTSNRNYGAWVLSGNWVRHALSRPLLNTPGTRMEYSTGNTHLLSAILTKASRRSTWEFAQENLARPMGYILARWPRDPQGIYFGGNDMLMTPRQMLGFGELYLNDGRMGDKQIVPAEWVKTSLLPRVQSRRENGREYGYGWWIREMAGYTAHYAWGYGGQFIFVVPELDLVAVTTSNSNPGTERREHLRAIYDLVEDLIVAPLSSR